MRFLVLFTVAVAFACTAQSQQEPRDLFRTAMMQALQINLTETVPMLQNIPLEKLSSEDREVAETIINRFSSPTFQFDESKYREYPELVRNILSAYQEYLFNVLLNKIERDVANSQFLETLIEITQMSILDDSLMTELNIRVFTGERLEELGFHQFLDKRGGVFDFMILKTQYEDVYEVELPEGIESVTVVFLDDFITFGWMGFATADRYHVGGWVMPDKIYCVKPSYDLESEEFHNYLLHEGQHFRDYRLFPHMENGDAFELEFRAKLAEIIMGKEMVIDLLNNFEMNQSDDKNIVQGHFYANRLIIQNLRTRLSLPENSKWENIELSEIQNVARQLLAEDTMRLVQSLKE